jgi:hypothetical protein
MGSRHLCKQGVVSVCFLCEWGKEKKIWLKGRTVRRSERDGLKNQRRGRSEETIYLVLVS